MTIFRGIIVFLLLCFLFSTIATLSQPNTLLCNQTEKHALLNFKHALFDPWNWLSSWSAHEDCCRWNGVHCHNISGRVVHLDLHGFSLGGKVSSALLQLEFLNYLDLSFNDFRDTPIPSFLSSMRSLTYLDLSYVAFGGLIPPQLGNLSNLRYLDLGGGYSSLYVENLNWISHLSSLEYLTMNGVDLHREIHWLESISMISSLSELSLWACELNDMSPSLEYVNFTSLTVLELPWNYFNHEIPNWPFNLNTSLLQLDLIGNFLKGQIPNTILELRCLNALYLSYNELTGQIPEYLGNLSSLRHLNLYENRLSGTLPSSLWLLSNLEILYIGNNSFADTISEVHFKKLSNLKYLDMSFTSLIFKVKSNWVPPFQLQHLYMSSCKMGPKFPTWLQTQTSLQYLYISNSGIVDVAPKWFWKWASHIDQLDLSDNQISGDLSGVLLNNTSIDLSSNCFMGELPRLSPKVSVLNMANNSIWGPISPFLCQKLNGQSNLQILDMSTNSLSGELPHCWMYWQSLTHLNLGNNNLSGKIPDTMGSLFELEALHLHGNSLSGDIPPSLRNCTYLRLLDLGHNKLSGNIPSWMGERTALMVLSLRSNRLIGNIPRQMCQLSSLIILDFADNSLSGTIPKCFNNFSSMATIANEEDDFFALYYYHIAPQNYESLKLVIKGKESEYKSILELVRSIDLSGNDLSGSIPAEITSLSALQSLNLSFNHLMGSIPEKIGSMKALECLDLSTNHLSGEIPQSMENLTFLNHLGLSYNNFSGRIPSGTQLQSFDALCYIGNSELCGAPLTKNCTEDEESQGMDSIDENEGGHEMPWFYIGMELGFIVGFWGVCGALLFKKTWRYAYFQFLYDVKDWVYVAVMIRWNRLWNNLRENAED